MRSSPDTSVGQPLAVSVPAPLISHMQFVDHDVLVHGGIDIGGRCLPVSPVHAWNVDDHKQILSSPTVTCGAYKVRSHISLKDDAIHMNATVHT
jgi:hypothetical protein